MKKTITFYILAAIALCVTIATLCSCTSVKKISSITKSNIDSSSVALNNLQVNTTTNNTVAKGIDSSTSIKETNTNEGNFDISFNESINAYLDTTNNNVSVTFVNGVLSVSSQKPIKNIKGNIKDFTENKTLKKGIDTTKQATNNIAIVTDKGSSTTIVKKETKTKQSEKQKTIPQLFFIVGFVALIFVLYKLNEYANRHTA